MLQISVHIFQNVIYHPSEFRFFGDLKKCKRNRIIPWKTETAKYVRFQYKCHALSSRADSGEINQINSVKLVLIMYFERSEKKTKLWLST